jgi:hypothetical protein
VIIFGSVFVAIGVAALAGLSIWPTVLIGLGAGMIITGLTGRWMAAMPWRWRAGPLDDSPAQTSSVSQDTP